MSDLNVNVNRADSKYKCFWDFVHVKPATQVLCAIALLGCLLSAVSFFLSYGEYRSIRVFLQVIHSVIGIFAYTGVLYGIYDTNPRCFLLCLGWLAIEMIIFVFFIFVYLVLGSYLEFLYIQKSQSDLDSRYWIHHYLLWFIVLLLQNIFIFDIIYKCYKYVCDKVALNQVPPPKIISVTTFPDESMTPYQSKTPVKSKTLNGSKCNVFIK